ncbi:hypothetical protein AUK22_07640 [bacterium CG2_30_54_10]|nr:MAG: hypothetical protein AUK22_07640 [bacterium CG2_30_54_10]
MPARIHDWDLRNATVHLAGKPPLRDGVVLVRAGKIAWVGPASSAPKPDAGARQLDLRGKTVLPGFQDAHLHPFIGAIDLEECRLSSGDDPDACRMKIRAYAASHPEKPFIRGSGWGYGAFPSPGPRREMLDEIVSDRPVFLKANDGHSAWANSAALRLAEIDQNTISPGGGVIERDPETGFPTGILHEWPVMKLVTDHFPKPGREEMLAAGRLFLAQAARFGITAIHDAQGKDPHPDLYFALEEAAELTLRVTASRRCHEDKGEEQLDEIRHVTAKFRSPLFRFTSAKVFIDGVTEARTAFLLEPYSDRPDIYGEPMWNPDHLSLMIHALGRINIPIHVHAVGDAGVRFALDAIERSNALGVRRNLRHQITHADLIDRVDMPRFAALGVIANLQPAWFYKDSYFETVTLPSLGLERTKRLYSLASLLRAGAKVACSSDWPFGGDTITFNPLVSIRAAVLRRGPEQPCGNELGMQESVPLATMLDLHTLGSAYANFCEGETGSIAEGKLADLAVVDRDLFSEPVEEIHQAKVLLTLLGGRPIWRDPGL